MDTSKLFPQQITYQNTKISCKRRSIKNYDLDFIEGGSTIFVTFFPADMEMRKTLPWGARFLISEGHSILGIKYDVVDWYRGRELHEFFRSEEAREFFKGFEKTVFYGASKGGYGALAFSDVAEAPIVIACAPQYSMDPELVPWENRYLVAQKQDWSGDYRDVTDSLKVGGKYFLCIDPFMKNDKRHANIIENAGDYDVTTINVPFAGHEVPTFLVKCGILKELIKYCVDGTKETWEFACLLRARKSHYQYFVNIANNRSVKLAIRRKCAEMAQKAAPDDPEVMLLVADAYARDAEYSNALEKYKEIADSRFARLHRKANKKIKLVEMAMNEVSIMELGRAAEKRGEYTNALEIFQSLSLSEVTPIRINAKKASMKLEKMLDMMNRQQIDVETNMPVAANTERWKDLDKRSKQWISRNRMIAGYVDQGQKVLDIGCGAQDLKLFLPDDVVYVGADIYQRDEECLIIDFNKGILPDLDEIEFDVAIFSGVLEYLEDVQYALNWAKKIAGKIILSYAVLERNPSISRRTFKSGFYNHFSESDFEREMADSGLQITDKQEWRKQNVYELMRKSS